MDNEEDELLSEARHILERENDSFQDELICECCGVTLSEIRELVSKSENGVDLELLKKELKLGSGCSSCIKAFGQWKCKL